MSVDLFDLARLMIYRIHEKGLEIFLIKPDLDEDPSVWKLPKSLSRESLQSGNIECIELENTRDERGNTFSFFALEGDYHDIPSIRGMIKHDLKRAKRKFDELLPDIEKGVFMPSLEIINRMLPHEREAVAELREIIQDRNLLKHF